MSGSVAADGLRAWGSNYDGQVNGLPAGADYVAIAAGDGHALALTGAGNVVAWGQNSKGQCNVPPGSYVAIGAGADFSLAIRPDGSIAAWGSNVQRQISDAPPGGGFVSVEGGKSFAVALRRDGSIVVWGSDACGQVSLAPTGTGFTAIAAGDSHAVALRSDGTLISWGSPLATAATPTTGTFTAIGAGDSQSLAVRSDGSIAWWGNDRYGYGLANVPAGTDYVRVAAGYLHALALKKDGSIVGWGAGKDTSGHPNWGQANPPAGKGYPDIACGLYFSLALASSAPKPVISDDFDDNSLGGSWRLVADDLANCRVEETQQRLELTATAAAGRASAFCLANGWALDVTRDFSFKIDYHYALPAREDGGVAVVLARNENDIHSHYVEFGAGACISYPYFWHEAAGSTSRRASFVRRTQDSGALYVSYDATHDALYLSSTGYGSQNAMVTTTLLSGSNGAGQRVLVGIGGVSDHEAIESGSAWLDDFRLDSGTVVLTAMTNIYRFWSPTAGRHFYTTSEEEKNVLVDVYSNTWVFEGVAFRAASVPSLSGMAPVYKFRAVNGQTQFYTISEREKDSLLREYGHMYRYDGVAFYAYPQGQQPPDTVPVCRFLSLANQGHLYTANEDEVTLLKGSFPQAFQYEGVAFCAYP
ncbi:MAG: hypothetical protein JW955_06050 [Sedimentisphaerales bacterium]|nr:hypothetical protein [Sedimentisphaerales bacterium]